MKADEIRKMKIEDMEKKVDELKEELFNLRFQKTTNQIGNPMRIRIVRKDIARIKTLIRENELRKN